MLRSRACGMPWAAAGLSAAAPQLVLIVDVVCLQLHMRGNLPRQFCALAMLCSCTEPESELEILRAVSAQWHVTESHGRLTLLESEFLLWITLMCDTNHTQDIRNILLAVWIPSSRRKSFSWSRVAISICFGGVVQESNFLEILFLSGRLFDLRTGKSTLF